MKKKAHARTGTSSGSRLASFAHRLDASLLANEGHLLGRAAGHKVHLAIMRQLGRLPRGSVLLVDLSRVKQASYTALREVFSIVDIIRGVKFEEKYLVFCADERNCDLTESIEMTVKDRGSMIPLIDRKGEWHNFGKLTKAERETLEAVERHGALTSLELRERFGMLASASSNRLRRLHHLRLIMREERVKPGSGGREFIYRPLFSRKRRR